MACIRQGCGDDWDCTGCEFNNEPDDTPDFIQNDPEALKAVQYIRSKYTPEQIAAYLKSIGLRE
jgi:hypothetical protein